MKMLFKLIDKAIFDYNLIESGDKILIGASGGKDSTTLAQYLSERKKNRGENFQIKCVTIQSDFSLEFPTEIKKLFEKWQIDFEKIDANIIARLKAKRKMNCFWCAMQRRTELLKFAIKNDFNKIALGHHLDDILQTLFMNMTQKAELSTMPPKLKYDKYPVTLIRPLCYADEKIIVQHAKENDFFDFNCTCTFEENSARKKAKAQVEFLTSGLYQKKIKIFCALKNINPLYLP